MWPTAKQVLEDRKGGTGDGKVSVLTFGSVFGSGDFRETLKVSEGRHARATLSPTALGPAEWMHAANRRSAHSLPSFASSSTSMMLHLQPPAR